MLVIKKQLSQFCNKGHFSLAREWNISVLVDIDVPFQEYRLDKLLLKIFFFFFYNMLY